MLNIKASRRLTLKARHDSWGYLFTAPWIIGFLFLFLIPFVTAIKISMSKISLSSEYKDGYQLISAGLQKYRDLFTAHPSYRQVLTESLGKMAAMLPLIVMFSLFAAVLINRRFRGRTLVRVIFFLPVILGTGVSALLQSADWTDAILTGTGETTAAMGAMRGSDLLSEYLTEITGVFQIDLIDSAIDMASSIQDVIQQSGVQILIFLAGLQSIPPAMYEASKIEGATAWESFWKITFPMISPMILVNIIYTVIDSFTNTGNEMMKLISSTAFEKSADLSLSTAMAMVYFVLIAVFLVVIAGTCAGIMARRNR